MMARVFSVTFSFQVSRMVVGLIIITVVSYFTGLEPATYLILKSDPMKRIEALCVHTRVNWLRSTVAVAPARADAQNPHPKERLRDFFLSHLSI